MQRSAIRGHPAPETTPRVALRRIRAPLAAAIGALILISCTPHHGAFSLTNKSGEPLANAAVLVRRQLIAFTDIAPGATVNGTYSVRSDSDLKITIEFKSGRILRKEAGYVANGMNFHHVITVTGSDVEVVEGY
jgi:hypothetical protein